MSKPAVVASIALCFFALCAVPAQAQSVASAAPTPAPIVTVPPEGTEIRQDAFVLNGQLTYISQAKRSFSAAYTIPGFNSLSTDFERSRTVTATIYAGLRLAPGTELYVNEEMVIGVPFSELHGLAAVPNSETQKASGPRPLFYMPRAFVRKTWQLGDDLEQAESGPNQLAGALSSHRIVMSAGKLSVVDLFDGNAYAHDGRRDFFNWTNVAGGAYDYAADVRGYSIGAAIEYYRDDWVLRAGRFLVPRESNGLQLNFSVANFHGDQVEVEHAHAINGLPGKLRALAFRNVELSGRFDDALSYASVHGGAPDVANVRRPNAKVGYVFGAEQQIAPDLGLFGRFSWNDGRTEMFSYTEVERSTQLGFSLQGARWHREQDTVGVAITRNGLSSEHRAYLAAGGTGFLIGDGKLTYQPEKLVEAYYSFALSTSIRLTADCQRIANPAYNADRGPVTIVGFRVHADF